MYEENSIDIASRPAILHGGESTRFQSGNNGRLQSQFSKWLQISVRFSCRLKGELGLPIVTKGLYMDFGLMLSSHGWKSPGYYYDGNYNPSAGEKPDKPSSGYTSDNKS